MLRPFRGLLPTVDPTISRNKLRARGLASKGDTLLKQGDYAGARSQFSQALALDPSNAVAQAGIERLKQLGM